MPGKKAKAGLTAVPQEKPGPGGHPFNLYVPDPRFEPTLDLHHGRGAPAVEDEVRDALLDAHHPEDLLEPLLGRSHLATTIGCLRIRR